MSYSTIWCHPHSNTSITFGTGGQTALKKNSKISSWDI